MTDEVRALGWEAGSQAGHPDWRRRQGKWRETSKAQLLWGCAYPVRPK